MGHLIFKGKRARVMLALSFCLALTSCTRKPPKSQIDPNTYAKEIEQWHQERWKELNNESGWLTLIGLFWLNDGANKCGSDPSQDIVLPKEKVPLLFAEFNLDRGRIFFVPLDEEIKIDGKEICKTGELKLLGKHNWQNVCAAVTAVLAATGMRGMT